MPNPIGSRSGMQPNESGSSLLNQASHQSKSPAPSRTEVLATPPKRHKGTTIQTMVNIELKTEPNGQGHLETVHLSGDSSGEYQNPCNANETGSETKIDTQASDISVKTISRMCHSS